MALTKYVKFLLLLENTFATVVLQIPVKGGHQGGRCTVEYQGKNKKFENQQNSDQHFYLSAYYGSCAHMMEPVTQGWKLTFVYSLVWTNVKSVIPRDFPVFITAMTEIQQALIPWIPDQQVAINAKKEDILFFILEEKYEENKLAFHRLRGKDKKLAQLLGCCPFLDVHLAMVTHEKTVTHYYGEGLDELSDTEDYDDEGIKETSEYKYSRWIDSTGVERNLRLELNLMEQYVGPNRNLLTSNALKPDKKQQVSTDERDEMDINKQFFYHGVLMIWPKHQTTDFYCRYGLESLLDRMETLLKASNNLEEIREDMIEDLKNIISHCCTEPALVWNKWTAPAMEDGELTLRLLRLCTALNAREEGLALLKVLGEDFAKKPKETDFPRNETFEGIQNEEVAEAIAEFECKVTGTFSLYFYLKIIHSFFYVQGWNDIAPLIKRLVSPGRVSKQLKPIAKLAECFHDVNCPEGAKMVEDSIGPSRSGAKQPKSKKEPQKTWQAEPQVSLPDHPEVEEFLRSSQKDSMTYAKFKGVAEARNFAASLEKLGSTNGFVVKVTTVGVGKCARCEISKHLSHGN